MTGSEHSSTSCTNSKPSQLGKEIKLEENCEQLKQNEASSTPSPSPLKGDKSLCSSDSRSNLISRSPPPPRKSYSGFTADYTKESMVGKEPSLCRTAGTNRSSSTSHLTMKKTIGNCAVRSHNASTLCSQESSYVYHYPSNVSRKNHQQQQHRSIQPSPTPSLATSIAQNYFLPLCEDTASDETQSMMDLCQKPSRIRTQHRASVRREKESIRREKEGSVNNHTSMRTTHCGAQSQAVVRDHLQHSSHQIHEKLPISKRQLDCTRPQTSSHIALERTCGSLALYSEQKQLFHNHHHQQPHHHTLHRLPNQHQMMRSHIDLSRGWSCSPPKSQTWQTHSSNTCSMSRGMARASKEQQALRSESVSYASDKRIVLHVPSGRKHESLI